MSESRPYLRTQPRNWWASPAYRAYTIRELTGVGLAIYAAILLAGLACLWRGPDAFEAYRHFLASPLSLVIHLLLLINVIWHAWTWFQILPKTQPKMMRGGKQIPQETITRVATLFAVACSVLLLLLAVVVGAWL